MNTKKPSQRVWSSRGLAYLGFFFSPVFASLLEAWDWRTVSPRERNKSLWWALVSAVFVFGSIPVDRIVGRPTFGLAMMLVPFFVWYGVRGRLHERRVSSVLDRPSETRSVFVALPFGLTFLGALLVLGYALGPAIKK